MRIRSIVTALVVLSASIAQASWVGFDVDPANDNQFTPQALISDIAVVNARFNACQPAADVGIGALAYATDFDFYSISVPAGCIVTAIVTPLSPTFGNPSSELQGGNSAGPFVGGQPGGVNNLFGVPSVGTAIQFIANPAPDGLTYVVVSNQLLGNIGSYALTVSVVPEPSTLALLGLGALSLIRRRK